MTQRWCRHLRHVARAVVGDNHEPPGVNQASGEASLPFTRPPDSADTAGCDPADRGPRLVCADLAAQDLKPATVVKAYQLFGKVMAAAVDAGIIAQSPCRRIPCPESSRTRSASSPRLGGRPARQHHRTEVPRARARRRLAACASASWQAPPSTPPAASLTVLEIATDVSGRLVSGPPKTRAARRTVGLPAPVAEELERHLATYAG